MRFTGIFITRPVLASTFSLLLLLVGLISLTHLTVRQYPRIDASVINVTTTYSGASSDLMEGFVTTPIENALAGIDNVDYITSTSVPGKSSININLKLGADLDKGISDVSNQVSSIRGKLPKEIDDPVIASQDPNAQPTMYIALSSQKMNSQQVMDYLLRTLQPLLQTQPGVGQALIFGFPYAMRIWLDPFKMNAHQVTASDVQQALMKNNIQAAAGKIQGKLQNFDVSASTDLSTADQFNNIYIRSQNGRVVRIRDVGEARLESKDVTVSVIANGERTTMLAIIPKSTANPLAVSKVVKQLLEKIQIHFPQDLKANLIFDSSEFIDSSLKDVQRTIFEAILFVFIVIFLTIGSFRAVLVPIVTIPLSLVGTFSLMLALGYTLNTLTFLSFVLAIGLVVDDAIVVLENIDRHRHKGMTALEAAMKGAAEIAFPVIAMTLTLAAVYAPIGFAPGLTGKFFTEFAFTLASSVIVSGFIALTLSPMMCSLLYRSQGSSEGGRFSRFVESLFDSLRDNYRKLLTFVLYHRQWVIVGALLIYALTLGAFKIIPQELAPSEDQGILIGMVKGPPAVNLNYLEAHTQMLEKIYSTVPEIKSYGIVNGYPMTNMAMTFIVFKPWGLRDKTTMEIQQQLFPRFWGVPGVLAFVTNMSSLPGAGGFTPIQFILKTTGSYEELSKITQPFVRAAMAIKSIRNVDVDLKIDQPQIFIDIDRNKATDLGISMQELADSFNLFLSQPIVTRFNMQGRSYDVLPELFPEFRDTSSKLNDLYVRTGSGALVSLGNVAVISERVIPESINHFQQGRSAMITATLAPGFTLGEALSDLQNLAEKLLPKDIDLDYAGESRQFLDTAGTMGQIFLFAILVIYLILAAQFESFRSPLIVMLSVPLSLIGAILLLLFCHGTLNIYSQIGLMTLIGLITKHGILIVEFTNQQRAAGMELKAAIIHAASTRLRPILMTTSAMVLGALPLALASGAGSVSRQQMGLVIIGGMTIGTILTLFVVPTAYYFIARKK